MVLEQRSKVIAQKGCGNHREMVWFRGLFPPIHLFGFGGGGAGAEGEEGGCRWLVLPLKAPAHRPGEHSEFRVSWEVLVRVCLKIPRGRGWGDGSVDKYVLNKHKDPGSTP